MAAQPEFDDLSAAWIQGEVVDSCYDFLHEHIATAIEREGCFSTEGIIADIRSGEMGAILIQSETDGPLAVVTVRTEQFPEKKILEAVTAGGKEFMRWRGFITGILSELAKETGCQSVRAYTRPGLAKGLVQLGTWRQKFIAVEMSCLEHSAAVSPRRNRQ